MAGQPAAPSNWAIGVVLAVATFIGGILSKLLGVAIKADRLEQRVNEHETKITALFGRADENAHGIQELRIGQATMLEAIKGVADDAAYVRMRIDEHMKGGK